MKKRTLNLGKKLVITKESISSLSNDQQEALQGGVSQNVCQVTAVCQITAVCQATVICPVQPTFDCISKKRTWCWAAGGSCG